MKEAVKIFPQVKYCEDPYDTVKGADAVAILTEWNLFRSLELERIRKLMKGNYFFDLRNVYDPQRVRDKVLNTMVWADHRIMIELYCEGYITEQKSIP